MVADVGGTNTRIALFNSQQRELQHCVNYSNDDFARFEDVLASWLGSLPLATPQDCCIAVAAPHDGDSVVMSNRDWAFSCRALQQAFGFSHFTRLNDFEANAHALPHLTDTDTAVLQAGHPTGNHKLAVIGPGTGLGGATLDKTLEMAWPSEPGFMGLCPGNVFEREVLEQLHQEHGRVYAELVLSGPGLERLYQAITTLNGTPASLSTPAAISSAAAGKQDAAAVQTLQMFCGLLGAFCGDYILANGAFGGLYLAGGIAPQILPELRRGQFIQRMCDKGVMSSRLENVPAHVIMREHPGLLGAAHAPLRQNESLES